jgi:DNA repair protein RadC
MIITNKKQKVSDPKTLVSVFQKILDSEPEFEQDKEHLWVAALNQRNVIQYIELVSLGSLTASIAHPREIFRMAILKGVAKIAFVHNHPSGEVNPSKEDVDTVTRIQKSGELLGIKLMDAIIIGNGNSVYFSFSENNQI